MLLLLEGYLFRQGGGELALSAACLHFFVPRLYDSTNAPIVQEL